MLYQVSRHVGLMSAEKTPTDSWNCTFGFEKKTNKFLELDTDALALLDFCFVPRSTQEVIGKFAISQADAQAAIDQLIMAGLLQQTVELPADMARYDRHILFYALSRDWH